MPSSEPDELLDSWLGDGVEGFTISAVWRNLGVWDKRLVHALARFADLMKVTATLRKMPHIYISYTILGNSEITSDTNP